MIMRDGGRGERAPKTKKKSRTISQQQQPRRSTSRSAAITTAVTTAARGAANSVSRVVEEARRLSYEATDCSVDVHDTVIVNVQYANGDEMELETDDLPPHRISKDENIVIHGSRSHKKRKKKSGPKKKVQPVTARQRNEVSSESDVNVSTMTKGDDEDATHEEKETTDCVVMRNVAPTDDSSIVLDGTARKKTKKIVRKSMKGRKTVAEGLNAIVSDATVDETIPTFESKETENSTLAVVGGDIETHATTGHAGSEMLEADDSTIPLVMPNSATPMEDSEELPPLASMDVVRTADDEIISVDDPKDVDMNLEGTTNGIMSTATELESTGMKPSPSKSGDQQGDESMTAAVGVESPGLAEDGDVEFMVIESPILENENDSQPEESVTDTILGEEGGDQTTVVVDHSDSLATIFRQQDEGLALEEGPHVGIEPKIETQEVVKEDPPDSLQTTDHEGHSTSKDYIDDKEIVMLPAESITTITQEEEANEIAADAMVEYEPTLLETQALNDGAQNVVLVSNSLSRLIEEEEVNEIAADDMEEYEPSLLETQGVSVVAASAVEIDADELEVNASNLIEKVKDVTVEEGTTTDNDEVDPEQDVVSFIEHVLGEDVRSWISNNNSLAEKLGNKTRGGHTYALDDDKGHRDKLLGVQISDSSDPIQEHQRPTPTVSGDRSTLETMMDKGSDSVVSVVTWNLAEESPSEEDAAFIRKFRSSGVSTGTGSDLVLISGQECENIKPRRNEGRRSREFRRLMVKMLGKQYVPIAIHLLGGVQFGLFARKSFLKRIEDISVADVTCGIGNVFHNKGAIAAFLKVKANNDESDDTTTKRSKSLRMVFVTAHMAAHVKNADARDSDFWRISTELEAQAPIGFLPPKPPTYNGSFLFDSVDRVFFCGDLNYRVDLPRELAEYSILYGDVDHETTDNDSESCAKRIDLLLRHDQLIHTMAQENAFPGFAEGRIQFNPTFKYDKESNFYDTSHKQRIPAWTDRILFRPSSGVRVLEYNSVPGAQHSDHRPVYGTFRMSMEGKELRTPSPPKKRRKLSKPSSTGSNPRSRN
jgi:hypothetical protein